MAILFSNILAGMELYAALFRAICVSSVFFIFVLLVFTLCSRVRNVKLTGLFFYTLVFVSSFPKIGKAINTGLDESWQFALNYFFSRNIQIGKDVLLPYGPLGFLSAPQPLGENLTIGICLNLAVYILLTGYISYYILSLHQERRPITMALFATLTIWVLHIVYKGLGTIHFLPSLGNVLVFLIAVLIINYDQRKNSLPIFLAAACVSVSFMIKFGWGLTAGLLLGSYLIMQSLLNNDYKLLLRSALIGIGAFLAIWLTIYHDLSGIGSYIVSTLQFTKGNDSAMALSPRNVSIFIILGSAFIILLISYLDDIKVYLISASFLLPFMAMVKYSLGRDDISYHYPQLIIFVVIYLFLLMIQNMPAKKRSLLNAFTFASLLFFCLPNGRALIANALPGPFDNIVKNIENTVKCKSYKERLMADSRKNLNTEILSKDMLEIVGKSPVDIYPWGATYIMANDLNWRPRPVFQSYVSYTPWLDKANYDFFAGVKAPLYIIWLREKKNYGPGMTASIDTRYLLNDEPETIYKILDDYEPILYEKKAVLLKKKRLPTFQKPVSLYSDKWEWETWIDVPVSKNSVIRCRIFLDRTLLGKIKRFLWKESEVFIEYRLKNGAIKKHRIVVDNAASGIWIHPYITDSPSAIEDFHVIHDMGSDGENNLLGGNMVMQVRLSYKDRDIFKKRFNIIWEKSALNH